MATSEKAVVNGVDVSALEGAGEATSPLVDAIMNEVPLETHLVIA